MLRPGSDRRRAPDTLASMRLSLYEFEHGVETIGGNRIVYDVEADRAHFGAATVDGPALVWQLDKESEAGEARLSRPVPHRLVVL